MAGWKTTRNVAASVIAAALILSLTGCSGGGDGATTGGTTGSTDEGGATTAAPTADTGVATTTPMRTRSDLVAVLGPPDAFRAELQALDGQDVLVESLVYGEIAQRFDLVNDVVTGSEAIDPFPDDTLFPLQYSVNEARPGMTRADVDDFLPGVEFTEIDGAGLDLPGAIVLAAGQLVMALLDDRVIYVETFPLVPDAEGTFQAYLQGTTP